MRNRCRPNTDLQRHFFFGGLTNANNGVFFTSRQLQLGVKVSF